MPGPGGPIDIDPAIGAKYTELGGESGYLGAAAGPQEPIADGTPNPGGWSSQFSGGTITWTEQTPDQFADTLTPN